MMHLSSDRLARAHVALDGLSVGDAFGERFFLHPDIVGGLLAQRALPAPPWRYTDDTEMALSLVAVLRQYGTVEQDSLAWSFAQHYDPSRGYGPAMHRLLRRIAGGARWREAASSLFEGQGSYGNGAAMRVAPLGAFFADDLDQVVQEATRSAEVTHAHPEGIAGAITVAVAAAWAYRLGAGGAPANMALVDLVLPYVPESEVRSRLARAGALSPGLPAQWAAGTLGNGSLITAQDTVATACGVPARSSPTTRQPCGTPQAAWATSTPTAPSSAASWPHAWDARASPPSGCNAASRCHTGPSTTPFVTDREILHDNR